MAELSQEREQAARAWLCDSLGDLNNSPMRRAIRLLLEEAEASVERLREYVASQKCECYNFGKRLSTPCERCRLLYGCESWDAMERAAEAARREGE